MFEAHPLSPRRSSSPSLSLTAEGLEALRTTWSVYARGIAEHFGRHVSDEEMEVLDRALCRISIAAREH